MYDDYGEVDIATKKKETKEENFVANILRAASVSYIPFQGQENIFIYVCYTLLDGAYDTQSMQQIMAIALWKYRKYTRSCYKKINYCVIAKHFVCLQ